MATRTLGQNLIGFHSGMHKRWSEYLGAALAFQVRDTRLQTLPAVDRSLAQRQLLVLPDADLTVTCLVGELWLTRIGDIEDYILGPGRSLTIRRGDQAIVEALQPSRVIYAAG